MFEIADFTESITTVDVQQDLRQIHAVAVSMQTICRCLKVNLKARRPATGPKLLREHRVAIINFADNGILNSRMSCLRMSQGSA